MRPAGASAAVVQTLLSNALILGTNLGTGITTARVLGPEGRGEQAAIMLWPQFVALALMLGIPSALVYHLRRDPTDSPQLLAAALLLGVGIGLVAVPVGILGIPYWLSHYSPEIIRFAQWMMLFGPLNVLSFIALAAVQASGSFARYNLSRYLGPLLTLGTLVLLASAGKLTPITAALAYLLAPVPIVVWNLLWVKRTYRPRIRPPAHAVKRMLSYGGRVYGAELLGTVAHQLDRMLVLGLLSASAMGFYAVALSASRVLDMFSTAVAPVLLPRVAGKAAQDVVDRAGRALRVTISASGAAALGMILLGPWLLISLYGQDFAAAAQVFRLLVLEVLVSGSARLLSQCFMAVGKPEVLTAAQAASLAVMVPALLLLVPMYGVAGAGAALLVGSLSRAAFLLASFRTALGVQAPSLVPRWSEIRDLVVSARKL